MHSMKQRWQKERHFLNYGRLIAIQAQLERIAKAQSTLPHEAHRLKRFAHDINRLRNEWRHKRYLSESKVIFGYREQLKNGIGGHRMTAPYYGKIRTCVEDVPIELHFTAVAGRAATRDDPEEPAEIYFDEAYYLNPDNSVGEQVPTDVLESWDDEHSAQWIELCLEEAEKAYQASQDDAKIEAWEHRKLSDSLD